MQIFSSVECQEDLVRPPFDCSTGSKPTRWRSNALAFSTHPRSCRRCNATCLSGVVRYSTSKVADLMEIPSPTPLLPAHNSTSSSSSPTRLATDYCNWDRVAVLARTWVAPLLPSPRLFPPPPPIRTWLCSLATYHISLLVSARRHPYRFSRHLLLISSLFFVAAMLCSSKSPVLMRSAPLVINSLQFPNVQHSDHPLMLI